MRNSSSNEGGNGRPAACVTYFSKSEHCGQIGETNQPLGSPQSLPLRVIPVQRIADSDLRRGAWRDSLRSGGAVEGISMAALRIRQDYSASDLRQRAARERDTRAS